jgi:hypothetical protein
MLNQFFPEREIIRVTLEIPQPEFNRPPGIRNSFVHLSSLEEYTVRDFRLLHEYAVKPVGLPVHFKKVSVPCQLTQDFTVSGLSQAELFQQGKGQPFLTLRPEAVDETLERNHRMFSYRVIFKNFTKTPGGQVIFPVMQGHLTGHEQIFIPVGSLLQQAVENTFEDTEITGTDQ